MSVSLIRKVKERKNKSEFSVPKSPKELDNLLRKIKETERILRQEPQFLRKVRSLKPKIELQKANETVVIMKKKKHKCFEIKGGMMVKSILLLSSGIVIQNTKY